MADAYQLRWKVDRPYLDEGRPGDVYALVTIEPAGAGPGAGPLPAHLVLLVDVSESMDVLVRRDPAARKVADATAEGRTAERVVSDVPSRREMAVGVVQKLVERLQPDDRLTLVAFDDRAHVLARAVRPDDLDTLWPAIQRLGKVGGGGTAMGRAFEAVRDLLATLDDTGRTRKLVLLTDGEDEQPAATLALARAVGTEFRLPIVAFGTGECKVAFLTELARTSLAGGFNHIRDEAAAAHLFRAAVASQQNVQATRAALQLWLSPDLHVRELYRTRPEILYVGDLAPDTEHRVTLRLEQLERGKAYEFLFRCTLPGRAAGQRFRLAKATLTYEMPGQPAAKAEANLVVEYTADPARAAERSGDVRRVLARAEVQRQVLFLQGKIDLLARGGGTPRDRVVVAKLLDALRRKFEEYGEQALVNQYRAMQQEFLHRGTISQEMLNRSLAASSRADDIVVAQDIDF